MLKQKQCDDPTCRVMLCESCPQFQCEVCDGTFCLEHQDKATGFCFECSEVLALDARRLRLALEKTQTEFGALIGKGLATVQRYETLVPPKGKVLVRLQRLAESKGVDECAVIFSNALLNELGFGGLQSDEVRPPAAVSVGFYAGPRTPEEQEMVFDVLQVMREARSTSVPPNSSVQLRRDQAIANVKLLKKATKSARGARGEAHDSDSRTIEQSRAV